MKIRVDQAIVEKTPELLKQLPDGEYAVTKVRTKDNPVFGESEIREGRTYVGELAILNRGGGPALAVGNFPFGGMMTSWVIEAARDAADGSIRITTENSIYKLEGPLSSNAQKGAA